jgi:hypothetical protein
MAFDCTCPATALTEIPQVTCPENLGQIQKIVFSRAFSFDSGATPSDDITVKANWDTKIAASDETKIVVFPTFVEAFESSDSAPVTEGGNDNSTLDGAPIVLGAETPVFTGMMRGVSGVAATAMRKLMCERDLEVIFINEWDKIIGRDLSSGLDGSVVGGFKLTPYSLFIGDSQVKGKNTDDKIMFQFSLRYEWRDTLVIKTPASGFSPLADIKPA